MKLNKYLPNSRIKLSRLNPSSDNYKNFKIPKLFPNNKAKNSGIRTSCLSLKSRHSKLNSKKSKNSTKTPKPNSQKPTKIWKKPEKAHNS
jgi:hypothetical protein